jgi:hypothetical protein
VTDEQHAILLYIADYPRVLPDWAAAEDIAALEAAGYMVKCGTTATPDRTVVIDIWNRTDKGDRYLRGL